MSKLRTFLKLMGRPIVLLQVIKEKLQSSQSKRIRPLIKPRANINKLYPVNSGEKVLIVSPSVGVTGCLASTNYFLSWLKGLRQNNIDARMVATYQTSQPMRSIDILWSDGVLYPNENGVLGIPFLKEVCSYYNPDIVISHGSPFEEAGARADVVHAKGGKIFLFAGESPGVQIENYELQKEYTAVVCAKYDGIIVMTKQIESFWRAKGFPEEKIFAAISLVDLRGIREIRPSAQVFCSLYFGNLSYEEVFDLIDIAKRVHAENNDFRLDVFGDAHLEQQEKYVQEIARQGCSAFVKVHESVDFNTMISYQKSAKMLLFPGRNWERANVGFPNKLGEYLSSGTPVVASNVGGISGLFHDRQELYLAKVEDNADFAKCCIECLTNSMTSLEVGARGVQWVSEHIDAKKNSMLFIQWAKDMVGGKCDKRNF